MSESNLMHGWVALLGSLAMVALILTAFGLMLGIVKPADVPKRIGAIVGIVIALMLAPGILGSLWSAIPLWKRMALVLIGIGIWQWRRPRRRTKNNRGE